MEPAEKWPRAHSSVSADEAWRPVTIDHRPARHLLLRRRDVYHGKLKPSESFSGRAASVASPCGRMAGHDVDWRGRSDPRDSARRESARLASDGPGPRCIIRHSRRYPLPGRGSPCGWPGALYSPWGSSSRRGTWRWTSHRQSVAAELSGPEYAFSDHDRYESASSYAFSGLDATICRLSRAVPLISASASYARRISQAVSVSRRRNEIWQYDRKSRLTLPRSPPDAGGYIRLRCLICGAAGSSVTTSLSDRSPRDLERKPEVMTGLRAREEHAIHEPAAVDLIAAADE
jgi:hypothetical protein